MDKVIIRNNMPMLKGKLHQIPMTECNCQLFNSFLIVYEPKKDITKEM